MGTVDGLLVQESDGQFAQALAIVGRETPGVAAMGQGRVPIGIAQRPTPGQPTSIEVAQPRHAMPGVSAARAGRFEGVVHQHGDGHWPHAARDRRDPAGP